LIKLRKSEDRGKFKNDWLDSNHTFSFGEYFDPEFMGISNLRVINDDKVKPGKGFATHSHQNMEIISYVVSGSLEHKDSMNNGSVIKPGDVQRMSAGKGVTHSEFNPSDDEEVNFLQIWIEPNKQNIEPDYEQKYFSPKEGLNTLKTLISPNGIEGSLTLNADCFISSCHLENGRNIQVNIPKNRLGFLHIVAGSVKVNEESLKGGDALSFAEEDTLLISSLTKSEFLVFELPETK